MSELDNWNPMAEDYACPKFNSYNSAAEEYDECSLYIKRIPSNLSEEAFIALMSENGRKVVRSKLFEPRPYSDVTTGVASFKFAKDAAEVMQQMNKTPPLNMEITYAHKKKTPTRSDHPNDFSSSHSRRPPHLIAAAATDTSLGGKGRGSLLSNALKFPALRIVLDGEKRSSFTPSLPEIVSSPPSDLPQLVENPFLKCLSCDNVGKFSCATCKKPYCSSGCQVKDWQKHKLSCISNKRSRDSSYVSESSGSDSEKKSLPAPHKSFSVLQVVKIKDIQTEVLPKDKHMKVKVSHIINPSKFWVQLSTAQDRLTQMERDLALFAKQTPTLYECSNVYCINQRGSCKRVAVLEVNGGKTASVQFLDYGNVDTVQLNQLFLLPNTFKEIPYQAVRCKLGDTGEENDIAWSEDDTAYFQMHSSNNQSYVARVLKDIAGGTYEVNLSDADGISLYSIISVLKNPNLSSVEVKKSDSVGSQQPPIPSVLSTLKNGDEVNLFGLAFYEDQFWAIVDDKQNGFKHIEELDRMLQFHDIKDYSLCAEEGDVVAGLSLNFKEFSRCVVLKRMRDRFLVHFIDYGSREEILKLCEMPPELRSRCCYVLCCSKPDSISLDELKCLFSKPVKVCVNRSDDNSIKLSFLHKNCNTCLDCFPWYHGILQLKSVKEPGFTLKNTPTQNTVSRPTTAEQEEKHPPTRSTTSGITCAIPKQDFSGDSKRSQSIAPKQDSKERITSDLVSDLPFMDGTRVKVVFIVYASKIFVQLQENEPKLEALCKQLNKHCSLSKSDKYTPIKNEIVCCRYKEDSNWYRGQVVGKKGNTYKVFFVDFGNEDWVTEEEMKPLPSNLSSHRFALCTSLHNVNDDDLKALIPKLTSEYWVMKIIDKSSSPFQMMLYQEEKPLTDYFVKKFVRTKASLSRQKLPEGKCDVMVSHTEKDLVYVQQMEYAKEIRNLCDKINSAAAAMPPAKEIFINSLYCALFSDGLWYRASIEEDLGSNQYLVTFIDFGNQETVDLKNLKELSEEFLEFPIFGIPVVPQNVNLSQMQLQILYPIEVTGEKSGAQLVKILNLQKKVAALSSIKKTEFDAGVNEALIGHSEDGVYYCVRCSDAEQFEAVTEKMQDCPDEKLISENLSVDSVVCAKHSDGHWYRGAVSKTLSSDSYMISFIDFGDSEIVSLENIKTLPEELVKIALLTVPCRINNLEKAKKHIVANKPLLLKTVGKSDDGIQTMEIVIPKSSYGVNVSSLEKQLLPLNETVNVFVCYVEEDIYYCQFVSDQERIKSLESKLQSAASYESLNELPDVGTVVCAKFSDNVWYRGSVEEICQSSNSCKISFIDYGNIETINVENLKILPPDMNAFPIFSIPVTFTNFQKLKKVIEDGAVAFHVQALELSAEGIQLVKVIDLDDKKPIYYSIAAQLLSDLPTEVTVSYEESGLYYVQKVSDENSLKEMMTNLLSPEILDVVRHTPKVGEIVCAKSSDNSWYRGMVKKELGKELLTIFLVDYGMTEEIYKKHVCYLPPVYASLPMFSIPIKLSNLNKYTTCLSVNSKYFVKCTSTASDNVHIVKVRPCVKSFYVGDIESSKLEKKFTLVTFHDSSENYYFLTKCSDIDRMNEMNRLLKEFKGEDIFDAPAVEEILIVKGADKNWYRGCITATDIRPGFCRVFLVDRGTSEDIPYSDICYMPEQFVSFPLFNIKVSLDSSTQRVQTENECVVQVVSGVGDIPSVQVVPQYTLGMLEKHHLPVQIPTKVKFCYCEREVFFLQVVHQIPLFQELSQEVQTCSSSIVHKAKVGELLVAQSSLDGARYRCCVQEALSHYDFKVNYIDCGHEEVVSEKNLYYLSNKLFKFSPFCIAVTFANSATAVELNQEYTVLAENLTINEPQVVKLILETVQQLVPPLSKEVNKSTEVSTQKYFYDDLKHVPFPTGEQDIIIYSIVPTSPVVCVFCAPLIEESLIASSNLITEITNYCENLTAVTSYEGEPPMDNEMVLAKFEGAWYRAVILKASNDSHYLQFVDFGNTETLPTRHMRRMTGAFMSLDIQAPLCLLTGFQFREADSDRIVKEIQDNFVNRCLRGVASKGEEVMQIEISLITEHLKEKNLIIS